MPANALIALAGTRIARAATHTNPGKAPELDIVMALGFFAAFLTFVCYLERRRHRWGYLALAVLLLLDAIYGIAAGAWPLGILQLAWLCGALARGCSPTRRVSRGKSKPADRWSDVKELYDSRVLNN